MKRNSRMRALLITSAAFAAAMCFAAGQAQANHVACGDMITTDTTLDSDLTNCPNNGILIGAGDITLDLNGHTVTGNRELVEPCPKDEFCDVGVLNDGHDGVTVRDGAVREFAFGAFVAGARHNRVLGISSSKNVFFGFIIVESARSVVRNSSGSNNPAPEGDGMGLFGSHHMRILHNSFRRNPLGIHVDDSTHNLIKGNRFSRNFESGIFLTHADRNQVRRNRCLDNRGCIAAAHGRRNVISGNRISGGVAGIGLERVRGTLVARNVVVHPDRSGIYLGFRNPPIGGSHNLVRRNRVRGSRGDGFVVREHDGDSRLRRNVAIGSGDDGFDVESRSSTLTRNRALRNAGLGIDAVRGVLDGGGNIARHNRGPRQCRHISCG